MLKSLIGICLVASTTYVSACGGGGSGTADAALSNYFLTASVDGVGYEAVSPRILAGISPAPTPRISVNATTSVGTFEITVDDPVGVATYTIGSSDTYILAMRYLPAGQNTPFSAGACGESQGTLTITKLSSTEIEGTFAFVGKQSGSCAVAGKNVTNGSFKSGLVQ